MSILKGSTDFNWSGRVFINYPLLMKGTAALSKGHNNDWAHGQGSDPVLFTPSSIWELKKKKAKRLLKKFCHSYSSEKSFFDNSKFISKTKKLFLPSDDHHSDIDEQWFQKSSITSKEMKSLGLPKLKLNSKIFLSKNLFCQFFFRYWTLSNLKDLFKLTSTQTKFFTLDFFPSQVH